MLYESIIGAGFFMLYLSGAFKRKEHKTKNAEVVTGWMTHKPKVKGQR